MKIEKGKFELKCFSYGYVKVQFQVSGEVGIKAPKTNDEFDSVANVDAHI